MRSLGISVSIRRDNRDLNLSHPLHTCTVENPHEDVGEGSSLQAMKGALTRNQWTDTLILEFIAFRTVQK